MEMITAVAEKSEIITAVLTPERMAVLNMKMLLMFAKIEHKYRKRISFKIFQLT
jgi:hypothetical protein